MTRLDAREIAGAYLASLQMESEVDLAINDDLTEEHAAGFVFFYSTADYWRTRDPMAALAGNGPILVTNDGDVVTLPTNRSIAASLRDIS